MHLEDPVAGPPAAVGPTHDLARAGRDVGLDLVARDLLMRELTDQMPGDLPAELPARLLTQLQHVRVQLLAGDLRLAAEVPPPGLPHPRQVVAQPLLDRVTAQHERAAEV